MNDGYRTVDIKLNGESAMGLPEIIRALNGDSAHVCPSRTSWYATGLLLGFVLGILLTVGVVAVVLR